MGFHTFLEQHKKKKKIAIIGGGAAGFFAAISAKEANDSVEVTIFEKARKVLAKVAITGGGRCNLTNTFDNISDLKQVYPRGFRLMKRLFNFFDQRDTWRWFESHGVRLVSQDDHCVFPESQDAMTVVGCLVNEARKLNVNIKTEQKIVSLTPSTDGGWLINMVNGIHERFDCVVIATGGMPHRADLLGLCHLGLHMEQPIPSLFTFKIDDQRLLSLMGTVVNTVQTTIPTTKFRASGPLLITHWGISGPAVLKLSSRAARHLYEMDYHSKVAINWVNITDRNMVEVEFSKVAKANPRKQLGTVRPFCLPSRLWLYMLHKNNLPDGRLWCELGNKGLNKLLETLTNDVYDICGRGTYRDEFVTCGGIALDSVDFNTLQSKVCHGLYFAGEVLDVDGVTGGFNLQAAWTTGFIVGNSIVSD